jgi:hypothetical protein
MIREGFSKVIMPEKPCRNSTVEVRGEVILSESKIISG